MRLKLKLEFGKLTKIAPSKSGRVASSSHGSSLGLLHSLVVFILLVISVTAIGADFKGQFPNNLSQVIHCLAIVNGAVDRMSSGLSAEVTCPEGLASELKPIRFDVGEERVFRTQSVKALARVFKSKPADGLVFRLVGHSDSIGRIMDKRKLSYKRANSLSKALCAEGVQKNRLKVQGRSDSEPFEGTCQKGSPLYNCNRRVSIEVIKPLVARVGRLSHGREPSSVIRADSKPHARYYPQGLVPGSHVLINLGSLELPDFSPKWHKACQGVNSIWKKLESKNLFDKYAGQLWVRIRSREDINKISWIGRSRSDQALVLELAASESKPSDEPKSAGHRIPDYWAIKMRIESAQGEGTALMPVFEDFRDQLLEKLIVPDCTQRKAERDPDSNVDCNHNKKKLVAFDVAKQCLSSLLNKEGEIEATIIEEIEASISANLPIHGDDELAKAYGVNDWTASFELKQGMILKLDVPHYMFPQNADGTIPSNEFYKIETGVPRSLKVSRSALDRKLYLETTALNDLGRLFPNAVANFKKEHCVDVYKEANNRENVMLMKRFEDLSCFGGFGALRVFSSLKPLLPENASNNELVTNHYLISSENLDYLNSFVSTIIQTGEVEGSVKKQCKANKSVTCGKINWYSTSIPVKSRRGPRHQQPSINVYIVLPGSNENPTQLHLGKRLNELRGYTFGVKSQQEAALNAQIKRQFSEDVVIERSPQFLRQWPVTSQGD
ncbi:MAG: OmpA family protein [Shewanella sp.]|nr:OmpA family protein [Shewanella sp.]